MPTIDISETFDIPYDSLSNEQRLAIKLLMEGKALKNPVEKKVKKTTSLVEEEKKKVEEAEGLNEQHKSDVLLLLGQLQDKLETFGTHTDKISGSSGNDLTEFFERISVASNYTRIMKSITGKDEEKYSFIFATIMEIGDSCLTKVSQTITCDDKASASGCGGIIAGSGVQGIAEELKKNPSIAYDIITCHLPTIIECIDNSIVDEELNLCEAKKVIASYSAGSRVVGDEKTNPFYSQILRQIVASTELKQSLLEIARKEKDEDSETRITAEFFKHFPKIAQVLESVDCDGLCCEPETTLIPVYSCEEPSIAIQGPKGPPGHSINGPMGEVGPRGPDGQDCECVEVPKGACCINYEHCEQFTEDQCLQLDGVYHGDNSLCSQIFCGTCGEDIHCPYPEICCNNECTEPCFDGTCPPCPLCNNGYYWCSAMNEGAGGCCIDGNCCVNCAFGDCGADIDCSSNEPYCCDNNCSSIPCSVDPPGPPPGPGCVGDCECNPNNGDGDCPAGTSCVCSNNGIDTSEGIGDAGCVWICVEPTVEPPEPCGPGFIRYSPDGDCVPDPNIWDWCDADNECPAGYACVGNRCVLNDCLCAGCRNPDEWYGGGPNVPEGGGQCCYDHTSHTDKTGPCYIEGGGECSPNANNSLACFECLSGGPSGDLCPCGNCFNCDPEEPCCNVYCPDDDNDWPGEGYHCRQPDLEARGQCVRLDPEVCCIRTDQCFEFDGCLPFDETCPESLDLNSNHCNCSDCDNDGACETWEGCCESCEDYLGNLGWPNLGFAGGGSPRNLPDGTPRLNFDRYTTARGENRIGKPGEFYTLRTGGNPPYRSVVDTTCAEGTHPLLAECCCNDTGQMCLADYCCDCTLYCENGGGGSGGSCGGFDWENMPDFAGGCCCCDNVDNNYQCGCCSDDDCAVYGENWYCQNGTCVDGGDGNTCGSDEDCAGSEFGECCNVEQNSCEICDTGNDCEFDTDCDPLCCFNGSCIDCSIPCNQSYDCEPAADGSVQCCYFGSCAPCGGGGAGGGYTECGCVPPCAGGGCSDCIVFGVAGCCPDSLQCCGGGECCLPSNCCGGNTCCEPEDECCGGECCGGDIGVCCGGECCKYEVDGDGNYLGNPCCIGGECVPICPDGSCPGPGQCNGGCGCPDNNDKCCANAGGDGTCCDSTTENSCCQHTQSGCPCPDGKQCCAGAIGGCCPEGYDCCNGSCQQLDGQSCCDAGFANECTGNGSTICCGDDVGEAIGCCHNGLGNPFCCDNCCDILCGGQICADNPIEECNALGQCTTHGCCNADGYCNSCWMQANNWRYNQAVYDGQGCDCGCNNSLRTTECTGDNDGLKYCCGNDEECCGDGCCGGTCCTKEWNGETFSFCCQPDQSDCCCWSTDVDGKPLPGASECCEDGETCCDEACREENECTSGCEEGAECEFLCTGQGDEIGKCCGYDDDGNQEDCCNGACYTVTDDNDCCLGGCAPDEVYTLCEFGCCVELDDDGAVVCRTSAGSEDGCPCPCECEGTRPNCTKQCSTMFGLTGTCSCEPGVNNCHADDGGACQLEPCSGPDEGWTLIGCSVVCAPTDDCTVEALACDGVCGCEEGPCCVGDNFYDEAGCVQPAICVVDDVTHTVCCEFNTSWCGFVGGFGGPCVLNGECANTCPESGLCPAGSTRNIVGTDEDGDQISIPCDPAVHGDCGVYVPSGGCAENSACPCGGEITTSSCTEAFAPPGGGERSMPPTYPDRKTESVSLRQNPEQNPFGSRERNVRGAEEELAKDIPLVAPRPVDTAINIKFQIVNFLASESIKTDIRTEVEEKFGAEFSLSPGWNPVYAAAQNYTESKSKASIAEKKYTNPAIGEPGSEHKGTVSEEIKGTLTTTIMSDGRLGKTLNMTFVAGSNIRLDTNTEANFIRISVDDLNITELADVDYKNPENNNMLKWSSGPSTWGIKSSGYPVGNQGLTGNAPGVSTGVNQGVILNIGETTHAGATATLTFDGDDDFIVGGTYGANLSKVNVENRTHMHFNEMQEANFWDTSEGVSGAYAVGGDVYFTHIIDWEFGAVQYITATGGGPAGGTAIVPILNMAGTGEAKTVTLIVTDGGLYTQGHLVVNQKWPGGVQPTLTNDGIDIISIMNVWDGTSYGANYCFLGGIGMS